MAEPTKKIVTEFEARIGQQTKDIRSAIDGLETTGTAARAAVKDFNKFAAESKNATKALAQFGGRGRAIAKSLKDNFEDPAERSRQALRLLRLELTAQPTRLGKVTDALQAAQFKFDRFKATLGPLAGILGGLGTAAGVAGAAIAYALGSIALDAVRAFIDANADAKAQFDRTSGAAGRLQVALGGVIFRAGELGPLMSGLAVGADKLSRAMEADVREASNLNRALTIQGEVMLDATLAAFGLLGPLAILRFEGEKDIEVQKRVNEVLAEQNKIRLEQIRLTLLHKGVTDASTGAGGGAAQGVGNRGSAGGGGGKGGKSAAAALAAEQRAFLAQDAITRKRVAEGRSPVAEAELRVLRERRELTERLAAPLNAELAAIKARNEELLKGANAEALAMRSGAVMERSFLTIADAADQARDTIASFGAATAIAFGEVAAGTSTLGDFGKAMLGALGDMASQWGQFFLLMGTGNLFIAPAIGAAQIGAGLALIGLGSFVSAKARGGAAQVGKGGGGGASAMTRDLARNMVRPDRDRDSPLTINLNIKGDVAGFAEVVNEGVRTGRIKVERQRGGRR